MTRDRLEAFSDGVFAIVITLLFIDIRLPGDIEPSLKTLWAMAPSIGVFILTFWIVGTYWVAHHMILSFVATVDRRLLHLNLLLLLGVVVTPLPAKMLAEHPTNIVALGTYAAVLSATNLAGATIWLRATADAAGAEARRVRRTIALVHTAPVAIYLTGFLFSFVQPWTSLAVYLMVPVFFTVPNPWIEALTEKARRLFGPAA